MLRKAGLIFGMTMAALLIAGGADVLARGRAVVKSKSVELPGVDDSETLDLELGGQGTGRLAYNTRTGQLVITARANVKNKAKTNYRQSDIGLLPALIDNLGGDSSSVVRDIYTVSKNGRAVYKGLARRAGLSADDFSKESFDLSDALSSLVNGGYSEEIISHVRGTDANGNKTLTLTWYEGTTEVDTTYTSKNAAATGISRTVFVTWYDGETWLQTVYAKGSSFYKQGIARVDVYKDNDGNVESIVTTHTDGTET